MTDDPTPTTARRQLGAQFRELRQARGLTAAQVAGALSFSVSKVSRMESGARAISEEDFEKLTAFFEVPDEESRNLAEVARSGRRRRGPSTYVAAPESDYLKIVQSGFVDLERDAEYVREFNSGVVPGLLQTSHYMRAMMLSAAPDDTDALDKAISLRLDRQHRLGRRDRYGVVIDEAVLARSIGGPAVMRDQLGALVRRVDDRAVDLRVIRFDSGYHAGLNSVFVSLTMGGVAAGLDAVFIEGLIGHQKFDKSDDLARFDRVWIDLTNRAESAAESRALLLEYRDRYARLCGDQVK